MPDFEVNENESVYYEGGYWNELDAVQRMFNQRIAGGTPGQWFEDFFVRRGKSFKRGSDSQLRERMGRARHGGGGRRR